MDIFASYAADADKELHGTWVTVGDSEFLIARSGNRRYVKLLSKLWSDNQAVLQANDDASDDKADALMVRVMASTILLGWKNVSYKGEPLEYSVENAEKILAHRDFRREVLKHAENFEKFKAANEEAAEGN